MKLLSSLRGFFKRKGVSRKSSLQPRPAASDGAAPKNGRLTLAVMAAIVLMIGLAALNVRLILDPSIAGKAFGPCIPSKPWPDSAAVSGSTCPPSAGKVGQAPPQVTFYSKLSAQEEQPAASELAKCDAAGSHENPGTVTKDEGPQEQKPPDKPVAMNARSRYFASTKAHEQPSMTETSLPAAGSGTGTYMVQVGAFSNPGIAQQWAARWKSRGYEVMLKPVARPKTGILYRLYLGKFASQQEADALVKRLKTKEGITAFRLLVRN